MFLASACFLIYVLNGWKKKTYIETNKLFCLLEWLRKKKSKS